MKIKVIPYNTLEYASLDAFPVTGESGKHYLALDTMLLYTWNSVTSLYVSADFRYEGKPAYHGSYLKSGYLEFTMVASPTPIDWHNGDYIRYDRTGRIYKLYGIPQIERQASTNHSGESFAYRNVQLYDNTKELSLVPFRDLIPGSGEYYFSSKQDVAFTGTVANVVERLNANLEAFFGEDVWNVRIADNIPESYEVSVAKDFSVSGMCIDALNAIYETWNELGWAYVVENGVNTIIIGYPNIAPATSGNRTNVFSYDNGLTALKRNNGGMDNFCTRMHVFGTERNLINRYYNGKDIYNAASVFIQNLMIPIELWGTTDSKPDASKAYIEDADKIALYGLITKDVYFDGTDGRPEIYPSIEQQTIEILKAAKTSLGKTTAGAPDYYPQTEDDTIRVDQIKAAVQMPLDDGTPTNSGEKYIDTYEASINSTIVNAESVTNRLLNQVQLFEYTFVDTGVVDVRWNGALKCVLDQALGEGDYLALKLCVYKDGIYRDTLVSSADFVVESDVTNGQIFNLDTLLSVGTKTNQVTGRFVVTLQYSVILANADSRAGDNTRIITITKEGDVVASANMREALVANFKIKSHQIGFDIAKMQSSGGATLAVRSGMCAGREFSIVKAIYNSDNDDWTLTCQRSQDTSTQTYYPNASFPIAADDEFVILGITMPEEYILAQAHRLYTLGQELFDKVSVFRPTFEPTIDSKKVLENITEHPFDAQYKLIEGKYMRLYDENLIDGNHNTDVLISEITINEGEAEIATYHVVLSDKATVTGGLSRTVSKLSTEVEKIQEAQRSQVRLQEQGSPSGTQTIPDGGSNVNPIYIKDGIPRIIDGLEVEKDVIAHRNIEAMGGVAAHGMATLQRGGGGGMGTVTGIKFAGDPSTIYEPSQGLITLPDYPTAASLISDGLASQSWVNSNFAGIGYEARVQAIEALIPSQATSLNQLADKAFVNSSIATATAEYQGNYNSVSDLSLSTSASRSDIATALGTAISGADNNDYCFVEIPTSDSAPTQIARIERYKFNGTSWSYEYTLNNSGFTAAQWATINSGLVSTGGNTITTLGTIATGVWHGTAITDDYIASASAWNAKYDKPSGGIPKTDLASGVQTSLGLADTALQSHQTIYNLIIKKNGAQVGSTYNPATAAQTIDITDVASANALSTVQGYFTNGVANNAARLSNTSKIGDTNQPVYFTANGIPAAISYTIGRNVAANEDVTAYTAGSYISVNSHVISAKEASGSQGGVVTTSSQTFSGDKTFNDNIQSMKGVAARGMATLQRSGGGGSGTLTQIQINGTPLADVSGVVNIPLASNLVNGAMSSADKSKLDNIEAYANNYVLPAATANALGGVKVGTNLSIDANGVLSAVDTTYSSLPAASGGTAVSLVTTGEKYLWNNSFLPKSGGLMYGALSISTENWENQLILNRVNNSSNWGASIVFNRDGIYDTDLMAESGHLYVSGDGGNNRYAVWDSSNDGSGSGLDADLLDGQHGSYYAAASSLSNYLPLSGGTMTGAITLNTTGTSGSILLNNSSEDAIQFNGGTTKWSVGRGVWNIGDSIGFGIYYGPYYSGLVMILSAAGNVTFNNSLSAQTIYQNGNVVLDSNNYSNYALSLSGGTMSGKITFDQDSSHRDRGIVGTYDYTKYAAIWAMGASYQIAADGSSLGSLYGAAYMYSGGYGEGHQFVWAQGGSLNVALGTYVWSYGGFKKNGSDNNYVLLGGGGHAAISGLSVNYATYADYASGGYSLIHSGNYSSYALPIAQVSESQNEDNPTWGMTYAESHRQSMVYNTSGREWAYWIGMRSSDTSYGTILRLSHDGLVQYAHKAGGGAGENWSSWKNIITSDNISSQSVSHANSAGNADTLDSCHVMAQTTNWNTISSNPSIFISSENSTSNAPTDGYIYGIKMRFHRDNGTYQTDLVTDLYHDRLFFRRYYDGYIGSWRELAFLDSNVASATQLQTSRSIWGQSFNGTGDVSGAMSGVTSIDSLAYFDTTNSRVGVGTTSPYTAFEVAFSGSGDPDSTSVASTAKIAFNRHMDDGLFMGIGTNSVFWMQSAYYGTSGVTSAEHCYPLSLNPLGGNVGIGTTSPAYKLDVNGSFRAGLVEIPTGQSIINSLSGYALYLNAARSDNIVLAYGGGNVGIGGQSSGYKLHVYGDIYANGGWLRTSGTYGWYSETYGGGWYCDDFAYVKTYGSRSIYTANDVLAGGNIVANGGVAARGMATLQGGAGTGNPVTQVNIGNTPYTPTNGIVSLPAYPTWSTLSGKPTNVSAFTNDSGYISGDALAVTFSSTTLTSSSTSLYLNNTVQRDTLQKIIISSANNNQQFNIHLRGSGSYYGYHRQVYIFNQSGKDIYIQLTGVTYISMGTYVSVNPNTGPQLVNYNPISMDDDYNYMYLLDIIQADSSEYPIVKITHLSTWAD